MISHLHKPKKFRHSEEIIYLLAHEILDLHLQRVEAHSSTIDIRQ